MKKNIYDLSYEEWINIYNEARKTQHYKMNWGYYLISILFPITAGVLLVLYAAFDRLSYNDIIIPIVLVVCVISILSILYGFKRSELVNAYYLNKKDNK